MKLQNQLFVKKNTKKHLTVKSIQQIRLKLRINKRKCEMLSASFCTYLDILILQVTH